MATDPGPPARMLLDAPASDPSLDFAPTAAGLAQIIERSEPRFAIGIFGGWGSGKTTLMEAIDARLDPETTVTVRFNAWRFEREPHILVPLLDAIREGLAGWAADHAKEPAQAERARKLARRIGRVVRALVTGLSAEVGISEVVKVKYDVGKAVDALSEPAEEPEAEQPQSLYFAGFLELERAFKAFAEDGATRVVVFVDDLDRCAPDVIGVVSRGSALPGRTTLTRHYAYSRRSHRRSSYRTSRVSTPARAASMTWLVCVGVGRVDIRVR